MGALVGAATTSGQPPSPRDTIIVASLSMALGIALGINRKRLARFFVEANGGGEWNRAVSRFIFGTGIPLMAVMFTVFGLIFEIYGWAKLL